MHSAIEIIIGVAAWVAVFWLVIESIRIDIKRNGKD